MIRIYLLLFALVGFAVQVFGQALPFPGPGGVIITGCTWHNLFTPLTLASSGSGFTNLNIRSGFPVSLYTSPAIATQIRVSVKGPSSISTLNLLYVGHSVSTAVFDGTQVQLMFGGLANTTIAANATVVSDAAAYAFDPTKPILASVGWGSSTVTSVANASADYGYGGASSTAGNNSSAGIATNTGNTYMVPLIEICF
jgi:hypothetical protein